MHPGKHDKAVHPVQRKEQEQKQAQVIPAWFRGSVFRKILRTRWMFFFFVPPPASKYKLMLQQFNKQRFFTKQQVNESFTIPSHTSNAISSSSSLWAKHDSTHKKPLEFPSTILILRVAFLNWTLSRQNKEELLWKETFVYSLNKKKKESQYL